jgi:NADH-quinone oxidoreductase subunit N
VLKLFTMLFVAVALLYSRHYLEARGILKGEYYVLALTAMLGIFVIISAGSLLTLYMGIELLSLSLYALVAFDRDSGVAAESAMKYFVLGAIASGCLLYGMSMIYGMTGTLLLGELSAALQGEPSLGLIMGVVFVVVGVAFKFGAVPFHMWVPDVYHGAPTSVTLFIATAPKIASFALAFRLLSGALGNIADTWIQMLVIVALLSALLGNVVAVAQTNLKRMLAYSAIGNVGFILFGFVAGTEQGYEAALYYTIAYVLTTLGAFGVMLLVSRRGFEADELDHYKGLHARDPLLAFIMMVLMFSLAGIPLTVGFLAKLQIFEALWSSNHLALVVFAAVVSVIGLFYYLRVVKILYFDPPGDLPIPERHGAVKATLALNAGAVVVLGVVPQALIELCARALG